MNIKHERIDGALVCMLDGEVNITTSPELRKAFEGIIKNNETKVLIDFSQVGYIDSSGLATLIEMLQRLKKSGGKLVFCNMSQKVKNVFEITKLDKLFSICESRDEALKSL